MIGVYLLGFMLMASQLPNMLNIMDLEEKMEDLEEKTEKQQKLIETLQKNSQPNAQKPEHSKPITNEKESAEKSIPKSKL